MRLTEFVFLKLYYFLFVSVVNCVPDALTINFYESLIQQGRTNAFTYVRPNNAFEYQPTSVVPQDGGCYDMVIVGAGISGLVLARSLSEWHNLTILIIDSGDQEDFFSEIPGEMDYLQGSRLNWNHKTTAQTASCLSMVDKKCLMPGGKGLGGSSVLNDNSCIRGNHLDYDSLLLAGLVGWDSPSTYPYFIKSENSQIDGDPGFHGNNGPLNVEYSTPQSILLQPFFDANKELLGNNVVDYNGAWQLGVSATQFFKLNGKRQSTRKAHLDFASSKKNLKVMSNSYVTKILIDSHKVAYGVQFTNNNQTYNVTATKKVILAAGAINSPQILLLSGIGPALDLIALGIPVVKDLPGVGKNLRDHVGYTVYFNTSSVDQTESLSDNIKDYLSSNSGPLTNFGNRQALAFIQVNVTNQINIPSVPNVELILTPAPATNDFLQDATGYTDSTYSVLSSSINSNTSAITIVPLQSKSTGTVKLGSDNSFDYPFIDTRYFTDAATVDISTMCQGYQVVLQLLNTLAFQGVNARLVETTLPECSGFVSGSLPYCECQVRHLAVSMSNPVGTCQMGLSPIFGAVVDSHLNVFGVGNLIVADTSVLPNTLSGHNSGAAAVMIGEKAADIIKTELLAFI